MEVSCVSNASTRYCPTSECGLGYKKNPFKQLLFSPS